MRQTDTVRAYRGVPLSCRTMSSCILRWISVGALVLTGCSSVRSADTTSVAAAEITLAPTDVVSPVLEFQNGGLTSDEIHNAKTRSVSSCMQQRGWTYEPLIQRAPISEPRTVEQLREFRQEYGYGMFTIAETGDESERRDAADRNFAYYSGLGADHQQAYRKDLDGDVEGEGSPPLAGSCEALTEVAAGIPLEDQAVMKELQILYNAFGESIEFRVAGDDWRACLAERGFEVATNSHPSELVIQKARSGVPPQELAAFEIEAAVADFECAFSTTMPLRYRRETEIVQELVERFPEWRK